jgi:hypothetical protein
VIPKEFSEERSEISHLSTSRRRILFESMDSKSIDSVFRPLGPDDPSTPQEPISVKKLLKGDGSWQTRKTIMGWIIDSVQHTIKLPPRRICSDSCRFRDSRNDYPAAKPALPNKKI